MKSMNMYGLLILLIIYIYCDDLEEYKNRIKDMIIARESICHSNKLGFLMFREISNTDNPDIFLCGNYTKNIKELPVYGEVEKVPVNESFPIQRPFSPYGNTKKVCEEILQDVAKNGKIQSIALRYFNPIGAHPSLLLGENPKNADNVMPIIQKVARGVLPFMQVFGDDYPTADGTCIRDYVHVVDIATAHVKALKRIIEGKLENNFEVYNLGSENGYSVFQLIKTFEEVNQIKLNYQVVGRREGDISQIYSDSKLAKEKLNWSVKYDLKEMLRSAWERDKKIIENKNG